MFNKNAVIEGYELITNGKIQANSNFWVSDYIPVCSAKSYYISGNKTSGTANMLYDKDKNYINNISLTKGQIVIPSSVAYIRFNGLLTELNNNIMVEQNTVATTYEPYVEQKIFVKNDNNVYEEFRKKEEINITTGVEFKTGRIIDGKTEYGKIINCGSGPNNDTKTIPTGLTNVTYTKIKGIATTTNVVFPLNGIRPLGGTDTLSIGLYITFNSLNIESKTDRSGLNIIAEIHYIKN